MEHLLFHVLDLYCMAFSIPSPGYQAALARVQSIADRLRALLEEVDAHDERDPGGGVTGMINQTAAMVSYRVREFEIDFDFVKQLKLKNLG
jgi:hypothetical protein